MSDSLSAQSYDTPSSITREAEPPTTGITLMPAPRWKASIEPSGEYRGAEPRSIPRTGRGESSSSERLQIPRVTSPPDAGPATYAIERPSRLIATTPPALAPPVDTAALSGNVIVNE
jgi:hypothetical protein